MRDKHFVDLADALNEQGYLRDFTAWHEDFARCIAQEEGVQLTDEHWSVIAVVRDFYAETGVAPSMRPLVKLLREHGGPSSSIAVMRLFGGQPVRVIARIAGLPRPENCL